MLVRYSGSVGAAILMTAALIYWMQLMISAGDFTVPARKPVTVLPAPRLPPPPVVTDRRPTATTCGCDAPHAAGHDHGST